MEKLPSRLVIRVPSDGIAKRLGATDIVSEIKCVELL